MEQEIDIQEVLKNLRETIGVLVQENAVLKAQITKLNTDS
jgi:cell division protein FtsB